MIGVAYVKSGELAAFKALARSMYFSNEVVEPFCASAAAGQMRAAAAMIEDEQRVRERRERERLMRKARFPQVESFEGCDFSQVAFPEGCAPEDLMGLAFVEAAEDFVFYGKTGRGKTRLAIAAGVACVQRGTAVRFFTAAELVMALVKANRMGTLEQSLKDIEKADVVIIDELGYVPLDIEGARLLFQVMNGCYEKRGAIVTTNIESSKRGAVFGDRKFSRPRKRR